MLKINIGFNRKVGEANFSSRGASVNLEIEVESGLVRQPDALQSKIDYMFNLAKASVDAQLNGGGESPQAAPAGARSRAGNGGTNENGNGSHTTAGTNGSHRASEKQISYVNQLARSIRGLGVRRLDSLTGKMFGKPLADLTSLDASTLIDTLKAVKEGRVSLDAASNSGVPT